MMTPERLKEIQDLYGLAELVDPDAAMTKALGELLHIYEEDLEWLQQAQAQQQRLQQWARQTTGWGQAATGQAQRQAYQKQQLQQVWQGMRGLPSTAGQAAGLIGSQSSAGQQGLFGSLPYIPSLSPPWKKK